MLLKSQTLNETTSVSSLQVRCLFLMKHLQIYRHNGVVGVGLEMPGAYTKNEWTPRRQALRHCQLAQLQIPFLLLCYKCPEAFNNRFHFSVQASFNPPSSQVRDLFERPSKKEGDLALTSAAFSFVKPKSQEAMNADGCALRQADNDQDAVPGTDIVSDLPLISYCL